MAITVSGTTITFNDGTTQTTAASSGIPASTVMLFVQTAAPTGWTKSTSHDNKALRVVSGTASSGGSSAFTTAFGTPSVSGSVSISGSVGSTTLTTAQLASHNHGIPTGSSNACGSTSLNVGGASATPSTVISNSAGSNNSHTHSFSGSGSLSSATASINVQYVDVIIATKN